MLSIATTLSREADVLRYATPRRDALRIVFSSTRGGTKVARSINALLCRTAFLSLAWDGPQQSSAQQLSGPAH